MVNAYCTCVGSSEGPLPAEEEGRRAPDEVPLHPQEDHRHEADHGRDHEGGKKEERKTEHLYYLLFFVGGGAGGGDFLLADNATW